MFLFRWLWTTTPEEAAPEPRVQGDAVMRELAQVFAKKKVAARAERQYKKNALIGEIRDRLNVLEATSGKENKIREARELMDRLCANDGRAFVRAHEKFATTVFEKLHELAATDQAVFDWHYRILFPRASAVELGAEPAPPWRTEYLQAF